MARLGRTRWIASGIGRRLSYLLSGASIPFAVGITCCVLANWPWPVIRWRAARSPTVVVESGSRAVTQPGLGLALSPRCGACHRCRRESARGGHRDCERALRASTAFATVPLPTQPPSSNPFLPFAVTPSHVLRPLCLPWAPRPVGPPSRDVARPVACLICVHAVRSPAVTWGFGWVA